MSRKYVIGLVAALAIIGVSVWLFLRQSAPDTGRDLSRQDDVETPAEADELESAPAVELVAEVEKPVEDVSEEEEEPDPEAPQLLTGRVVGEGQGIPGADVRFFAVAEIEGLILRLEPHIPRGEIPDIPKLIGVVSAELEGFRSRGHARTTDGEGRFDLRGVDPGGYIALTYADGWLFRYGDVFSLSEERTEDVVIELDRGASVGGRVLSSDGLPVPGATVVAEYRPPGLPGIGKLVRRGLRLINGEFLKGPFETTTDAGGLFRIDSLPAGFYDLAASSRGGVETRLEMVETGTESAVVILGDPAVIQGLLVDADGEPVPNLIVRLERTDERIQLPPIAAGFVEIANTVYRYLGEPPRDTKSDADGRFVFRNLGAGKFRLSVQTPGFLPKSRSVEVDWGGVQDLGEWELDRGHTIRGIVLNEEDEPIESAQVLTFLAKPNAFNMGLVANDVATGRLQVRSDAEGRFEVSGLRRADYRLIVTRDGYAPDSEKVEKGTTELVEFRLEPGVSISGVVLLAGTEEPVAGAWVRSQMARTRTDDEGKFTLDGVIVNEGRWGRGRRGPFDGGDDEESRQGDGPSDQEEEDEEAPRRRISLRVEGKGLLGTRESLDLDELPETLEVFVREAPAIEGVVFDPEGNPAPGSLVRLTPAFPDEIAELGFFDPALIFLGVTVTDLEGRFRMEDFQPAGNGRLQVIADHIQYARGESESFRLGDVLETGDAEDAEAGEADTPRQVEVRLVQGADLRGLVTDGRRVVPGATLRLARFRERSGEESFFINMLGLPPGGSEAHSNSEGVFEYSSVLPGEYVVSAEVIGYTKPEPVRITLEAGDEAEVKIELDPGGSIVGVIRNADDEPLADATVRLLRESTEQQLREAQRYLGGAFKRSLSNADGSFQIDGLPEGSYTVLAEKNGYQRGEVFGVEPDADPLEIYVVRSAGIRGIVTDLATGAPVTRFSVRYRGDAAGEEPPWARRRRYEDANGKFSRTDLAPGPYTLELSASGYLRTEVEVVLAEDESIDLPIALARAGRLEGRVFDKLTGRPVRGARLQLIARSPLEAADDAEKKSKKRRVSRVGDESPEEVVVDPAKEDQDALRKSWQERGQGETAESEGDGSFVIDTVPVGPQTVVVRHANYATWTLDSIEVEPGAMRSLDVGLESGLALSGVVRDADGSTIDSMELHVRGTGSGNRRVFKNVRTDSQGRYRVEGLTPGSYRLFGARGGRSGRVVPLELDLESSRVDADVSLSAEE